jgi:type IV pilus assembly protein PilA
MNLKSIRSKRGRKGFTLIELLVVVLILAILMAVALPLYLNAVADSEKKTCRANLQTIANSVQAARVERRATDYSFATGAVSTANEPDLQSVPKCPSGGTYSVGNGSSGDASTYKVTCTVGTHGSFEPGVDAT